MISGKEFYNQKDANGEFGGSGMMKLYNLDLTVGQGLDEAVECGYDNLGDYMMMVYEDLKERDDFTWVRAKAVPKNSDKIIFVNGNIICREISGGKIALEVRKPNVYDNAFWVGDYYVE